MSFMPLRALTKRELLTTLRSPRPYAFMGFIVLLGAVSLSLVFYEYRADGAQFSARDSRSLFSALVSMLYAAGALLIPPMAAVSVCVEKQQGNLELLKLTCATPGTIVLAKICGVMGMYTMLLAAAFPFFGVLFFFAGLDASQVLLSAAIIYSGSLAATTVGVACSCWCHRTIPAILTAIVAVFVLQYGLLGIIVLARETFFEGTALAEWSLRHKNATSFILSPLASLVGMGDVVVRNAHLLAAIVLQVLFAALGLIAAVVFLRRTHDNASHARPKPIDDPAVLDSRRRKFPFYILDPSRRRPPIGDRQNPVYAAERRSGITGQTYWRIRIAVGVGAFYFLICAWHVFRTGTGPGSYAPFITPTLLSGIILLCVAPVFVAPAMAREYEQENVDMLRTTLLKPREIATGKLLAALAGLAPLAVGMLFGSIPLIIAGYAPLTKDAIALAVILPYSIALIAATAWGVRSTATSLILGIGAAFSAHAVIPFASLYAIEFTTPRYFTLPVDDSGAASFLSPLLARIYVHDSTRYGFYQLNFDTYSFWNQTFFILLTIPLACVAWWQFRRQFNRS